MGGTGALWRPIAAGLEDEYQVFAPDQRGHGASILNLSPPHQPSYTPLDYGQDVVQTFEPILAQKNAVLIGHSMGVRTAVAAAHLAPKLFDRLVLIDLGLSGPAGGGMGEDLARFLKILPLEFESRAQARTFMDQHCPDPSIAQYLLAVSQIQPQNGGRLVFPFDKGALISTIDAARDSSVRTLLKAWLLQNPQHQALVLRGEKSLVWSAQDFEQEQQEFKAVKNITFETMAGCGHGLPFEVRTAFIARLKLFLNATSVALK